MKKQILICFLLCCASIMAQQSSDAPWMKSFEGRSQEPTFQEIQQAFNAYWETHDKDAKGSGYKIFKRWEHIWESRVDANGYLPSPEDQWRAWQQKKAFETSNRMAVSSNWEPMGPFSYNQANAQPAGLGRLSGITVDPNDPNTWYVGSPGGGVWKTTDAAATWNPLSDDLPRAGVSSIAVDYNDSNIIYIATGDDDGGGRATSIGVYKSIDGGVTWNVTGLDLPFLNGITKLSEIFIDPTDSNKLICSSEDGIFITTDAGVTWTKTLAGNNIRDMRLKPGDAQIVYAVSPTTFFRSTDGGVSFTEITTGVPSNARRMVIDVTPADPNYVYIFSQSETNYWEHGIFRSTNSGQSFTTRSIDTYDLIGNAQIWYNMAIGVSDTDVNELYVGTLDVHKSTNGGSSWNKINRWDQLTDSYTHADIHTLRFYNGRLFCASDGGLYSSTNGGANFEDNTAGLQIGEFYRVSVASGNENNIVGGLQDNGGFGLGVNGDWRGYHPGDGVNALIPPNEDNRYYGLIQNGDRLYISDRADGYITYANRPSNSGTGVWQTPMASDSNGEIYAAWDRLFKLNKNSNTWEAVGNVITGYTDELEIAPSDPMRIVSAGHQNLRVSTDGGVTYDFNTNVVGNAISDITIHQTNPDIMWIVTDGNYANKGVFKTIDGGYTWENITANFPAAEFPNAIVHQGDHPLNPIFVATDLGVYRLDDSSPNWEPFFTNLPNVDIRDLAINLDDYSITAATYGRGIWRSQIPVLLQDNDVRLVAISNPTNNSSSCGNPTAQLEIKNNGMNTIHTITISYTIDGGNPNTYDWEGTLVSTETTTVNLPEMDLETGSHTLSVTVTINNDANSTNNDKNVSFSVNTSGEYNAPNSFETSSDNLVIEGGVWQRGVPAGSLLNNATTGTQVYGTNLSGNYPFDTQAFLVSNCYDFTTIENPILKFNMAFDIEEDYDWANVEYSLDGGQSWSLLGSYLSQPNWFNSNPSSGLCSFCPDQWTGTNATMTEYGYDFAANAANLGETDLTTANNITFRIGLYSDNFINHEGIIIDDFVVEGTPIVSKISPVAFLQGAGINPVTGEENLMRDDLRVAGLIPTTSPYTDMITCDPTVFNQGGTSGTGNTTDDIVDWVWVELRDGNNRATVIAGQSALLQRDGDIVGTDGTSPLSFSLAPSNYHIKINHRNHLGIATSNPITLGATASVVDFTADSAIINGGNVAVTNLTSGKLALYAGDGNTDGSILNTDILNALQQSGASGYLSSDVNMDTFILNNDIQIIIQPNAGKIEQE